MLNLLATLLLLASDTVHLKDGKKVEGQVFEFVGYVDVITADGKKHRFERTQIARIERGNRLVRFPETRPFPHDVLKDVTFDFTTRYNIVCASPKHPQEKTFVVDVDTGKQIWELETRNPIVRPAFHVNWLLVFNKEKFADEKQKYKFGGATFSKDVERITITLFDLLANKEYDKIVLDNNDRNDVLYGFIDDQISVHGLRDHLFIRATKSGNPMDRGGTVDKAKTVQWTDFYFYNLDKKKAFDRQFRSEEVHKGVPLLVTDEHFIFHTVPMKDMSRVTALNMKDGRVKWKTEPDFKGLPVAIADEKIIARDDEKMWAYALKTGKKLEKWGIDHAGSEYAAIDDNAVYVYRKGRQPQAIVAYDIRKCDQVFMLPMPAGDEYMHRTLFGTLLVYTDRKNAIHAFDVARKTPAWKYVPPTAGIPFNFFTLGGGLVFLKDGKVTEIETSTGRLVWHVPAQDYARVQDAGDRGVIMFKKSGVDLARERPLPKKAVFLNDMGTPLRFTVGADTLPPPAAGDGTWHVLSNKGMLYTIKTDTKALAGELKVCEPSTVTPPAPTARGALVVISYGGRAIGWDTNTKARAWESPHRPSRLPLPFEWIGDKLLLTENTGMVLFDPAAGKEVWRVGDTGVANDFRVIGGSLYMLDTLNLHEITIATGRKERSIRVQEAPTLFGGIGKETVYVAKQGYRLWSLDDKRLDEKWALASETQDPKIALHFRGALEFRDGTVFWVTSDGALVAIELATGKKLWNYPVKQFVTRMVVHGGKVWFAAPGVGLVGLDAKTGQEAWKEALYDADRFTPVVLGDKLYFWSNEGWMIEGE